MRVAARVLGVVLAGVLSAATVGAEPLDVTDPTSRPIRVEFEVSEDPTVVGESWSAPFQATYAATGNVGTVVVPASGYAAAIETHDLDFFDLLLLWTLVPGSASELRIDIDLTTLEATAQPASHQITIPTPPQIGSVTRELDTAATAGFTFHPDLEEFPIFCTSSEFVPCLIVPGAPYDPQSGTLHAVGSDLLDAPDVEIRGFSRAGDLRLSELPASSVPALPAFGAWGAAVVLAVAARRRFRARRR